MSLDTYTELEDIMVLQLTDDEGQSDNVLVDKFLEDKRSRKPSKKLVQHVENKETSESEQ